MGGGGGRVGGGGGVREGRGDGMEGELHLTLHCHLNIFRITMGSDVRHFNMLLTVRGKSKDMKCP